MTTHEIARRQFLKTGLGAALAASSGLIASLARAGGAAPVVSIVRIANDQIEAAVERAIDLLGGIAAVTAGQNRILLKPNLVGDDPSYTTKPAVIRALARLMMNAGKEVSIGEGSAVATGITYKNGTAYATRCQDLLQLMQKSVFDKLGYTELAASLGVPLLNLHVGEMVALPVPNGLYWNKITLHRALSEVDLLCSVPMMKTHSFASVTLGLKNVIGLYPGSVYGSFRWWVHTNACTRKSPGIAFEILDMARVNKLGLTVIDASTAMEGDGPTAGTLVNMNLIIAGTHPVATDLVAASVMGFQPTEIPVLVWAQKLSFGPGALAEIEVRGESIASVRRPFVRPHLSVPSAGADIYPAPQPRIERGDNGSAAVIWDEATPKAIVEYNPEGLARVGWTNAVQGGRSILETNSRLAPAGWVPISPASPGRHVFNVNSSAGQFFRLRKP